MGLLTVGLACFVAVLPLWLIDEDLTGYAIYGGFGFCVVGIVLSRLFEFMYATRWLTENKRAEELGQRWRPGIAWTTGRELTSCDTDD